MVLWWNNILISNIYFPFYKINKLFNYLKKKKKHLDEFGNWVSLLQTSLTLEGAYQKINQWRKRKAFHVHVTYHISHNKASVIMIDEFEYSFHFFRNTMSLNIQTLRKVLNQPMNLVSHFVYWLEVWKLWNQVETAERTRTRYTWMVSVSHQTSSFINIKTLWHCLGP